MKNRQIFLTGLLSIAVVFSLILPAFAIAQEQVTPMVAAGGGQPYGGHTVGLKDDGTVVAAGDNDYSQCDVGSWTGITQVAAGGAHTVGLTVNGTVVAVGCTNYGPPPDPGVSWLNVQCGQCNVGEWTDIIQVATGGWHTVGLKHDGTVVAVGQNYDGQCNVDGWTHIIQVAAGGWHTVGLKDDGTVVAVGDYFWQLSVDDWTDIVQVAAGDYHTVGLKSDGTVVAVGDNDDGQCNVGAWTDIVQVAAGEFHTVGLKSNGTVVAVGDNYDGQCNVSAWRHIVQVAAGNYHTVGLRSNATVVAAGFAYETDLAEWNLGLVLHPASWPLIGGITAAALVATGLGILFVRRRRHA
jgi:alpha-tubulin suppressor-like RCC1 family protein